ncbi:MAG: 16S rRNA (cytidine(1402)-2'-O)-methyltransferase [Clostridia bacterium]|nr:16S rRNA (cytidine(1402)-2'-O)-methyltransferase [Clostridia bacterium]
MFYFVYTPIGNLKDMTYRAVEVLNNADIIACEDTRTSLKLLSHYEIKKTLVAYHKFNEKTAAEKLISEHENGKTVAIITDAGTPVLSDPGNILTTLLRERGIPFTVVPGATAFVPALLLSGMDASRFAFVGFLPEKKKESRELIEKYKNYEGTLIFYSAPHDLKRTVAALYETLGNRKAAAVKEITKIHESVEGFYLADGIAEENPRGEYVVVVEGGKGEENAYSSLSIKEHLGIYLTRGMTKSEAAKAVAKDRNIKKSEVYKTAIDENMQ